MRSYANVVVVEGDGSTITFAAADVIYVNAGATRPADIWLDRLRDGGRLVLPLTTGKGFNASEPSEIRRRGAVFLIERQGQDFRARWISPVAIFPCEGMRNAESEAVLSAALEIGGWETVTGLHCGDDIAEERCWLRAPQVGADPWLRKVPTLAQRRVALLVAGASLESKGRGGFTALIS